MSNQVIKAKEVWTRIAGGNNMLLENDKFYISYNPIAGAVKNDPVGELAQLMGGMVNGESEPQEETALYDGKVWRILLGDYRREYEEAFPDWKKCLAVYNLHKLAMRSGWSTDDES